MCEVCHCVWDGLGWGGGEEGGQEAQAALRKRGGVAGEWAGTQAWSKRFPKIRPVFVRRTITRSVYCCQDELAHRLIYRTNPVAQTIRCMALKGLIRRFRQIWIKTLSFFESWKAFLRTPVRWLRFCWAFSFSSEKGYLVHFPNSQGSALNSALSFKNSC